MFVGTSMALAPAIELARKYLVDLEPRWTHVQSVGRAAEELCRDYGLTEELAAAAWLHDIGYSPDLALTGFHPLDGARFLQRISASNVVISLVAHHSGARFEAEERGCLDELMSIPEPPAKLLDVLVLVDMTTSPDGQPVTVDVRLAEILGRYTSDDPVHRAVSRSAPQLRVAARRAAKSLGLADIRGVPVL